MSSSPPPEESSSANPSQSSTPYSQIAAQHIRELAAINQETPSLLRTSAHAISLLTNHPLPPPSSSASSPSSSSPDPTERTALITSLSHTLLLQTNQIRHRLKTQVDQLIAAGVIPAEPVRYRPKINNPLAGASGDGPGGPGGHGGVKKEEDHEIGVLNGGLGALSVADLNARAGVRQQGDEEILSMLQALVGDLARLQGVKEESGVEKGGEDEEMVDG